MKTIQIYSLFIVFTVSILVVTYLELFLSLGLEMQFALGIVYLIILVGLVYLSSSKYLYNKHRVIMIFTLVLLVLLMVLLSF
ncbi:hypothetical protein M1384_00310 [Candidatus Parvarchaeota archaeon]|nr:hypothetical protein [Candidatus Parvarchaeota archaeon]